MSQPGANTPANHFGGSFGPNEWLVQEMYERFQSDPASVDKAWWEFFSDFKSNPTSTTSGNESQKVNKPGVPPIPKSQISKSQPEKVFEQSISNVAPVVENIAQVKIIEQANEEVRVGIKPADPIVKPIPTLITPDASSVEPLRGVAARVMQSMEGSLSVPTATSVRAVPAKLMIDNRTVINNHLKRGRGGKVSFTHLIGYAMIKAIRAMPEMNTYYTELDGKPAIGHPEHVNLGIAIDLS